jgi:hypothetical protein
MLELPEVFVSHSSQNELGTKVREAVVRELESLRKYEVFWDKGATEGGDGWRIVIDEALNTCDGAVLVLSDPALSSWWVAKEVNILLWRKALDPGLHVVPVLVPPVTPKDERLKKFLPDQLSERTFIECDDAGAGADAIAANLAAKTKSAFATTRPDQPDPTLSTWLEDVRYLVGQFAPLFLERAAAALGMNERERALQDPRAKRRRDLPERIAHGLLHAEHKKALQAVAKLNDAARLDAQRQLAARVLPLWVKAEAASYILPVTRQPEAERILALNCTHFRTAHVFLARAMFEARRFQLIEVGPAVLSSAAGTDLFNRVCFKVARDIGLLDFGVEPDGEQAASAPDEAKVFKHLSGADLPIFLSTKRPLVPADAVVTLRRFPHLTLLFLLEDRPLDPAVPGQPTMRLIRPELGPTEEDTAWVTITRQLGNKLALEAFEALQRE